MQGWKLNEWKGHRQWVLGKIDSLKWVLEQNLSDELRQKVDERIKRNRETEEECNREIGKILAEREEKKKNARSKI